jgi:hypothetical protein
MKISITRRAFFGRITIVAVSAATRIRALRIGLAGISRIPIDQRSMGLALGVEEATHAAGLFGGSIDVVPLDANDLSAIIAANCEPATARDVLTLTVGCSSDEQRRQCQPMLFHVAPSESTRRAAATRTSGRVVAWDASLTRFGADTLNQRFLKRFGQPMHEDAWTAWLAVKMIWEGSLRTRSTAPEALAEFLGRTTTQFDGHKGRPLRFRASDHQLLQPLYVVDGERTTEILDQTQAETSERACGR